SYPDVTLPSVDCHGGGISRGRQVFSGACGEACVNAIEVHCLSKTFVNGRKALDNLDLAVGAGEMGALIGAPGSGKTTLIRHLSGLVTADKASGSRIKVKDAVIQEGGRLAADVRAARREIGVVFQQFNLVGRLSVLTNVLAGRLGRTACWRGTLGRFTT